MQRETTIFSRANTQHICGFESHRPYQRFSYSTPLFVCGNIEISNVLLELEHLSVTNRLSGVIYAE